MIRFIASVVVLVLALGSARLLACEWVCAQNERSQPEAACHDSGAATNRVGAAIDGCDHADDVALVVTTKSGLLPKDIATAAIGARANVAVPLPGMMVHARAPAASAVIHRPLATVLRI